MRDCGLVPFGVDNANDGKYGLFGSGVFGGAMGKIVSPACASVVELIHFSSRAPMRGGDASGNRRNASAKWSLMNLVDLGSARVEKSNTDVLLTSTTPASHLLREP